MSVTAPAGTSVGILPFHYKLEEPLLSNGSQFVINDEEFTLNIAHIITEDDTPVDNLASEKQQRLLTEPLYSNWLHSPFLAAANVGIFAGINQPPIVPDMFLSLGVQPATNWWQKQHRSYFLWEFGKAPEVVVEMVSNKKGGELSRKLKDYAQLGVLYYVVYDPEKQVQTTPLVVYELHVGEYFARKDTHLAKVGLSLTLWTGVFEQRHDTWLRWAESNGTIILTGAERAAQEKARAEEAEAKAEEAVTLAEKERRRAEKLLAQLKALGIEPEGDEGI